MVTREFTITVDLGYISPQVKKIYRKIVIHVHVFIRCKLFGVTKTGKHVSVLVIHIHITKL